MVASVVAVAECPVAVCVVVECPAADLNYLKNEKCTEPYTFISVKRG